MTITLKDLAAKAKERPDDLFLKGSGVTKLIEKIMEQERALVVLNGLVERAQAIANDIESIIKAKP